jgi:hypothetical protein
MEIFCSRVAFKFYKVKAHQDTVKSLDELDRWEKANVKADHLAKQYLEQFMLEGCPQIPITITTKSGWLISLNNEIITTSIQERIQSHIWAFQGKQFWVRCLQMPEAATQFIWWGILTLYW